jgi:hypothetical protein
MTIKSKLICLIISFFLYTGCSSTTNEAENKQEQDNGTTMSNEYITGQVKQVQTGKDGYTAQVITADSVVYFATISRANLKENANEYRTVAVGETIIIKGDVWNMGDETHVTVRELK